MMKRKLCLILLAAIACLPLRAEVISAADALAIVESYSTEKHGDKASEHFEKFVAATLDGKYRYAHGLTGDGYGGPCDIIDGYYTGGKPENENYYQFFVPDDPEAACVVEYSLCENEVLNEMYASVMVQLYSASAANRFSDQLVELGFKNMGTDEEGASTFSRGDRAVTLRPELLPNDRGTCYHFYF
ncbi:MAG: hypothetical protein IJ835_06620 [Muribaculaceae bacterium]|nr:hypothetical protein [Muribaculaceae bacterium]